jgi:hypothetical protein
LIEAKALIEIYGATATGHQVLADFDLVAANSGGSLVVGGLMEDLALNELLQYFQDEAKRHAIFSPTKSWGDRALHALTGIGPKYSADAKLPALERLLPKTGAVPLPTAAAAIKGHLGAPLHAMIVGFDYDRNRAKFFRSAAAGGGTAWGSGDVSAVTVAEAIHASTNAPVNYFDGPAAFPNLPERYWDGGVTGCNNPALAALTEAVVLGQKPGDVVVLSIGTGTVFLPLADPGAKPSPYELPRTDSDVVTDLRKLATSILDDPPDAATFVAHAMPVGVASRIVRMNPLIAPIRDAGGKWTQPPGLTVAQFKYLCDLDMDAVGQNDVMAITQYCDLWLKNQAPNQPIRMDGATLKTEIGYDRYGAAKTAWLAIK